MQSWQNFKVGVSAWAYEIPGALHGTHSQPALPRKELGFWSKLSKPRAPRLQAEFTRCFMLSEVTAPAILNDGRES